MEHDLRAEDWGFRLRPVTLDDAAFMVDLRAESERTRYLNPVSPDVERQREWLRAMLARSGDRTWIVERSATGAREGMIALYNEADGAAEWGRWILVDGSVGAMASALLLYGLAFETVGKAEVYCRTVADNRAVVGFHDRCGLQRSGVLPGAFVRDGVAHDVVEHRLTASDWPATRDRMTPLAAMAARLLAR